MVQTNEQAPRHSEIIENRTIVTSNPVLPRVFIEKMDHQLPNIAEITNNLVTSTFNNLILIPGLQNITKQQMHYIIACLFLKISSADFLGHHGTRDQLTNTSFYLARAIGCYALAQVANDPESQLSPEQTQMICTELDLLAIQGSCSAVGANKLKNLSNDPASEAFNVRRIMTAKL